MATRLPALCCPPVTGTTATTSPSGICCPPPGQSLHPRPMPVTPTDPCADAKPVTICGSIDPLPVETVCSALSIPYEKCDGTTGTATGTTCDLIQVVPHPDAVMNVRICNAKDVEKQILCDQITGHKVAIISDFTDSTIPVVTYWDLNTASAWTGSLDDLGECPETELESDPREVCVDGVSLTQWVVKANGEPTGTVYYTDVNGQIVTVNTATATIVLGACKECECVQSISDATGDDLSTLLPGTTFSFTKPECCVVKITTDIGSFTIRKGVTQFVTQEFKCAFSVTAVVIVSGTCTLDEVHIISNSSINTCCAC